MYLCVLYYRVRSVRRTRARVEQWDTRNSRRRCFCLRRCSCRRRRRPLLLRTEDGHVRPLIDVRPSPGPDANDEIKHCGHVHNVHFYIINRIRCPGRPRRIHIILRRR